MDGDKNKRMIASAHPGPHQGVDTKPPGAQPSPDTPYSYATGITVTTPPSSYYPPQPQGPPMMTQQDFTEYNYSYSQPQFPPGPRPHPGNMGDSWQQSNGTGGGNSNVPPGIIPPPTAALVPPEVQLRSTYLNRSIVDAYLLAIVLGYLGAHHFYLRRYGWGCLYFCTFGLIGFGYVIDLFRIPYLVRKCNRDLQSEHERETGLAIESRKIKDLSDAYVAWLPFGLLGFHHYYLGRYKWGLLYTFTFGLLGIGWIVDGFRMPSLVRNYNKAAPIAGVTINKGEKNLLVCYLLGIPFGFFGLHHFYMNRLFFGVTYALTFGLLGVGWIVDCFRMPTLLRRCNDEINRKRRGNVKTLDDCYLMWFPFGLLGYHHFYLRNLGWGLLYHFTFGLLGVGWLVDLCRIPCLVKKANQRDEEQRQQIIAITASQDQNPAFYSSTDAINRNHQPPSSNAGVYPPPAMVTEKGHLPPTHAPSHGQYYQSHLPSNYQGAMPTQEQPPSYEEVSPCIPPSAAIPQPPPYEK